MRRFLDIATVAALSVSALACPQAQSATQPDDPQGPGNPGTPPAGIVQGRVLDAEGNPLGGVKIVIDHTVFYNSAVTGRTDAQGNYRIEIPAGSWRAYAKLERDFNGERFAFDLHPDDGASFTGATGTVRNFQWKLSGRAWDMLGREFYGGEVQLFADPNSSGIAIHDVEFTFTPQGPLVDGTAGRVIVGRSPQPQRPHYSKLMDVPIGRYLVTARYAPVNGAPRPMNIRIGGTGEYAASVVADFVAEANSCRNCLRLEVNWQ